MALIKPLLATLATANAQALALAITTTLTIYILYTRLLTFPSRTTAPISVNYHFTRKCNKTCAFCFHTEKTSDVASQTDMARALTLLKAAGMRKINFAGGEPFLYPDKLGWLCQFCKSELGLESVSIITNGTKVTEKWLQKYGKFVDVMGVSCDSFDEGTNIAIGRGSGENVQQLFRIRDWCRELGIKFKLNTVVCTLNWREDMAATVEELDPFRWKVFQVLFVEDENSASTSETALDQRKRDARALLVSAEQFGHFCDRHKHLPCFVPEPNELMASSYLILDEHLCFLDKGSGREKTSRSILEVGVAKAMSEVRFDGEAFVKRGGLYDWTKQREEGGCGGKEQKELEW